MANTSEENKQTAKELRSQRLLDIVYSQEHDWIESLHDFLEEEVRHAYGRGFRDGQRHSTPRERRRYGTKGSAVANGRLRPVDQREGA
jgi:hypothetical protein